MASEVHLPACPGSAPATMPAAANPSAAWPPLTSYLVPGPLGGQLAGCEGAGVDVVSNEEFATRLRRTTNVAVPALFVSSASWILSSGSAVTTTLCVPARALVDPVMLTPAEAPAASEPIVRSEPCTTPSIAKRTAMLNAGR